MGVRCRQKNQKKVLAKKKAVKQEDKKKSGESRINARINPVWREAFGFAAKARWTDATGLIHQFVKAIVDIERKKQPIAFNRFGDLDSIPLQDSDETQEVPVEAPEDIKRIVYMAEIAMTAQNLLRQSAGSDITIDQAAAAIIQSLEAAGDKIYNKKGGLGLRALEEWEQEDPGSEIIEKSGDSHSPEGG
jgi:hypothetical protein